MSAQHLLDERGIDWLCDSILDGKSYGTIADELGINRSSVHHWVARDAERSARVRAALEESASQADEYALQVLENPKIDPQRAREIASHMRWRARVRNPRTYGDKVEVNQTGSISVLADPEVLAQLEATRAAIAKLEGEREEGAGDAVSDGEH